MGFSEYWPQPDNDKNKYTDKGAPKTPSENTTAKKDVNIFNEGTTGVNNTVYNKTSSIFDSNKNLNQSNNEMFGQTNDTIPALNPSVLNILDYTEKQVQEIVIKVILDDAENSRLHLMQQNNGVISGLYDKYKEWRDDDLSLSNVEEAVVLQQESADNLQKAKDGNLSKKEYFLQNREHLKTMMKRRLFRKDENTGLDFLDRNRGSMTKEEFEKMMEDYINYQIDRIDKLDSLKNFQRMLFVTTGNGLEQMLLNYKKKAEEVKHNPAVEQKFTHKEFSNIPQEYDSTEPITFEEVFKFERNQEYSTDRIINYLILEANTTGAFNAYDNRNKYYSNLEIYKQYMASIGIDVNKQVQEFKEDYDAVMNNGVMNLLNNWDGLQYDNNYESFLKQMDDKTKSSHRSAFGEDYAIDLVQAMEKDNKAFMETIDKCTDGTQIAGLGCTIVGGILCFTPAAAAGAGLITLGNTLSIGGLAAENVLGYTEALTRQHVDSKEIEELNNSLLMDAGGFLIGAAAGKAGMKAFNKLIDVKLAEVFKLQTFKGNRAEALKQVFTNPDYLKNFMQAAGVKLSADFLISYAGDLAMSEVLGTDDDWESLLKANLIGLAASTSGDISNVARIGMKGEKYRELKQQVQNRSQEYRESLNETFANVDSKYKNSTEKYQQVIDKAVKCYEEFGVKIEFEDINGDYGATVTEIYKELHNFSKINGLKAPDKIKIKKGEKTEVYWDKNTNEITYVIGDKVKSDDVRYSLRHELVHGNDTKPELGDEFHESFKKEKIDEYIKEMLKAGLIPEEIAYAFQNRKEFLAIASQGDVSKYESLKQVLADCGMPEEVLNMPLADIHSRKVNCSDEELNNLAQQTIDQINRNGGVGYKPSGNKFNAPEQNNIGFPEHGNKAGEPITDDNLTMIEYEDGVTSTTEVLNDNISCITYDDSNKIYFIKNNKIVYQDENIYITKNRDGSFELVDNITHRNKIRLNTKGEKIGEYDEYGNYKFIKNVSEGKFEETIIKGKNTPQKQNVNVLGLNGIRVILTEKALKDVSWTEFTAILKVIKEEGYKGHLHVGRGVVDYNTDYKKRRFEIRVGTTKSDFGDLRVAGYINSKGEYICTKTTNHEGIKAYFNNSDSQRTLDEIDD